MFTGPGPGNTRNLLVLNIGMESDHVNENYEVNMWGKYWRIYPEFAKKQNRALFKVPYNQ
jgi:hypothetical protein